MSRACRGLGLRALFLVLVVSPLCGAAAASKQEAWDAIFLDGVKIGKVHTYIEPVKDRGRDLFRVRVDTELTLKRQKNEVTLLLQYGTIETPDGSVLKLDTLTRASDQEIRAYGNVINGQMTLKLNAGGQEQQKTIAWGPDVRGPYAVEQSLSRKPLEIGESRDLKMFMPDVNGVFDVKITAKERENVVLGDGTPHGLLKVEQTTSWNGTPRPEFDVTHWVDNEGQVLKSLTPLMGGLVMYRTTREGAEEPNGAAKFDQIEHSVVKVTHRIPNPETTRDVRYRLTLKDSDATQAFPSDRRQTVRPDPDKSSVTLDVKTAGPNEGEPGPEGVAEEFLRPNALIDSSDPSVRRHAFRAIGGSTQPWEKAVKIEHWVFQNMRTKDFSTAFAPASEVARNLTGDCTEHGVLTAAMCRAVGVPARVAVGLLYVENLGGFGFHLWNEVYVNRRWVAIDAAFDQSAVDAVHIKLSDSSLDGVAPFEAFLPVVRVLGKLSLEPVELR